MKKNVKLDASPGIGARGKASKASQNRNLDACEGSVASEKKKNTKLDAVPGMGVR